jgi:hypothetical protein
MRDWMGFNGEASYTISTDFIPANVDPARMTAIWQMFVAGDISFTTYFQYLERGEVYPTGWTEDDETKAIEEKDEKDAAGLPLDGLPGDTDDVEEAVKVATLSGIQIEAANTIIQSVASGALTREAAINQLIVFLGLSRDNAEKVMQGVETGDSTTEPGQE